MPRLKINHWFVVGTLLLVGGWPAAVYGGYRSIYITNTDVCTKKSPFSVGSKPLAIGEGAIIFRLKNPPLKLQGNIRNKREVCEIQIKAPENHGIMVHVEEMRMRQNAKDGSCVDYLQFGQSDPIPFITISKSRRICGEINSKLESDEGFGYDDPGGNLLMWINLGGRRETTNWPYIGVVNVTLVVTSYRKSCAVGASPNFLLCGRAHEGTCVRKDFFCDRHLNCPTKEFSQISLATDEQNCPDEEEKVKSTDSPDEDNGGLSIGDLNLISWTLILVCTGIVLVLIILVVCRARKSRNAEKCPFCCCCTVDGEGNTSIDSSCEYPPHAVTHSVAELASRRQRRGREDEQNVYLPLSVLNNSGRRAGRTSTTEDSRQSDELLRNDRSSTTNVVQIPGEEAPPAYNELFPDGVPPEFQSAGQGNTTSTPGTVPAPADPVTSSVSNPTTIEGGTSSQRTSV